MKGKKSEQLMARIGWLAALAVMGFSSSARGDEIRVSAAASLTDVFNENGKAFTRANPNTIVRFNFGSSGALQQQIEQGAPVDVFASAASKEMDALQKGNYIESATRINFAGNRLVLIAPLKSKLRRWEDLSSSGMWRIALANPDSVPAGRYAKETLLKRRLWVSVQPRSVLGENVRQTLTYVANGDADAGLVFATDAKTEMQKVRVVAEAVPGKDHAPIVYPAAVVRRAPNVVAARRFTAFLKSKAAQDILGRYGFARAPR